MEEKFKELKEIWHEISDLAHAATVLAWDQETYMPVGGAPARASSQVRLSQLIFQKATSEDVGELIQKLLPWAEEKGEDSDEHRMMKIAWRNYERAIKMPPDMVAEQARMQSEGNMIWREARAENDFAKFQPVLEKWIDFNQRFADLYKPYDHPYDVLLNVYEEGMKTADVKEIFNTIRPKQVELIEKIAASEQLDDSVLHRFYAELDQAKFGRKVVSELGYDFNRGSMDTVHHPFQTSLAYGDNRITVKYDENFFNPFFFGALHEAGHAMYEQGVPEEYYRTPLYGGTSLAIHESQSRMWENLVGRSLPFWEFYFPQLKDQFPDSLKGVSLDQWYKAINKVAPSLIRIEADESTYNLHIMLRLELEIEMLEGTIAPKDLPEAWNTRFEEYLGIKPDSDADGCLQDVHWSFGLYGYFSTYALGNLVSVQLWDKMLEDHPNVDDDMRKGDFSNIFNWYNEKVYKYGSKYEPQELVQRITGSKIDGDPYIKYLNDKYSDLYGF